jgi:hypothetical protein
VRIQCDCAVFSLPTMEPQQLMVGHMDWVFGAAWLTDHHFVSARCVWDLTFGQPLTESNPAQP